MFPPQRALRLLALAISALAFTGCAPSMRVNSFTDRGIDFARYRTYSWDAAGPRATGDPRLDNNPFFHERIRMDVDDQLAARGLTKVTVGTPGLLVRVHVRINQRIDPTSTDRGPGYGVQPEPFLYDAGMIMLDFVDARTGKVVWRGWAESSMDAVIENQAWMEEKIDQSVARILSRFPRGV